MIAKANKLSFWIASLILCFSKLKDRRYENKIGLLTNFYSKALAKILTIGEVNSKEVKPKLRIIAFDNTEQFQHLDGLSSWLERLRCFSIEVYLGRYSGIYQRGRTICSPLLICRQAYSKLQTLFDPSGSFKNYRQELASATGHGPVLPYL
jgi:hypothetical protein